MHRAVIAGLRLLMRTLGLRRLGAEHARARRIAINGCEGNERHNQRDPNYGNSRHPLLV